MILSSSTSNLATGGTPSFQAFHDADERRSIAIREAFKGKAQISDIAAQFDVRERDVWSAIKSDRSIGHLLDERYWRHGLTVSLGNGLNVSEHHARRRLRYVALRLKRMIWGNDKRQRKIEFFVFKHQFVNRHKKKQQLTRGSRDWTEQEQRQLVEKEYQSLRYDAFRSNRADPDSFGVHWHAVMAVRGNHGWSDDRIANAILEIERNRKREHHWEKPIDVQWNWQDGNAFHDYIGREAKHDGDSYFVMTL